MRYIMINLKGSHWENQHRGKWKMMPQPFLISMYVKKDHGKEELTTTAKGKVN